MDEFAKQRQTKGKPAGSCRGDTAGGGGFAKENRGGPEDLSGGGLQLRALAAARADSNAESEAMCL